MTTSNIAMLLILITGIVVIGFLVRPNRWQHWLLATVGGCVLIGSWAVLYWVEALFTESHLVGYYCCVTAQDLPAAGTIERTISDFFRTTPGAHLPALVFVATSIGVIGWRLHRERDWPALLPALIAANALYLVLDVLLVSFGWGIAGWIHGPQLTAYNGLERSVYGIVFHLVLWCAYFWTIGRLPAPPWDVRLWRQNARASER